jgi:hypothetical protein
MHVGHTVPTVSDVTIEPLTAEQWRDLKRLRIAALTDAPDAFSPTAAEAESHADVYWQRGAARAADGESFRLFVARRDGAGLGLASAQCDAAGIQRCAAPASARACSMPLWRSSSGAAAAPWNCRSPRPTSMRSHCTGRAASNSPASGSLCARDRRCAI